MRDSINNLNNFDYIKKNIDLIREKISGAAQKRPEKYKIADGEVRLLAVTKTVDAEKINFAVAAGVDLIGENRVNELLEKYDKIAKSGLGIHFIGNLQTNKVKYIIDKVSMIQSVDSIRLAEEINKRAAQRNITMDILTEINIGDEESKIGIKAGDALDFINALKDFGNLRVKGLMTVPPFLKAPELQKYFTRMHGIFIDIASQNINIDNINMRILSMGMSEDYEAAILRGANIIRVGRAVFGERL